MQLSFKHGKRLKDMLALQSEFKDGTFLFCEETDRLYIKMHNDLIGITPNKRELGDLKCKFCGATLEFPKTQTSIVKCNFCGSVFDIDLWNKDVDSPNKTEVKVETTEQIQIAEVTEKGRIKQKQSSGSIFSRLFKRKKQEV